MHAAAAVAVALLCYARLDCARRRGIRGREARREEGETSVRAGTRTERVALLEKLGGVALVEGSGEEEDHVVDHVPWQRSSSVSSDRQRGERKRAPTVGDVVKELGELRGGVAADVVELLHKFLRALLRDLQPQVQRFEGL